MKEGSIARNRTSAVVRYLDGLLTAAPTRGFLWLSTGIWFVGHLLIWGRYVKRAGYDFDAFFTRWDATYYAAIARDGADAAPRAFFPLFPRILGALGRWLEISSLSLLGAVVSTVAFAGVVRRSRIAALALLLGLVALNVFTTRDFGAGHWAY